MEKIYSKIEPSTLLHLVYRLDDIRFSADETSVSGFFRTNIAPENEYLQLASLRMQKGHTFKAHKHISFEKTTDIAQESWLVIKGSVKCIFYDVDDTIIAEPVLFPGDLSMTFRGGHNYVIMEDDTIVYEYKTGPYLGIQKDKVFLKKDS